MDIREKLADRLWEAWAYAEEACGCTACSDCPAGPKNAKCMTTLAAGHLIAHGVTVQEWHPASEPPGNFVSVLGYMTDAEPFPPVRECYAVGNGFYFPALGGIHSVSHWCEMPQPPKGE